MGERRTKSRKQKAKTRRMPDKYKHTWAERKSLLRDLRQILKYGDERQLMQVLRNHGIMDEDPRFAEIVKLFQDLRSGKT